MARRLAGAVYLLLFLELFGNFSSRTTAAEKQRNPGLTKRYTGISHDLRGNQPGF
jgi:hypothetical protein